jgi:hypothetical protein
MLTLQKIDQLNNSFQTKLLALEVSYKKSLRSLKFTCPTCSKINYLYNLVVTKYSIFNEKNDVSSLVKEYHAIACTCGVETEQTLNLETKFENLQDIFKSQLFSITINKIPS